MPVIDTSGFLAWVPCLGGRLFFANSDISLGDYDFFRFNRLSKNTDGSVCRKIVLSSVVDWQDTKHWDEPFAGLSRVILVAKTNDENELVGRIYFIEKGSGVAGDTTSYKKYFRPRPNIEQERGFLGMFAELSLFDRKRDDLTEDEEVVSSRTFDALRLALSKLEKTKVDVYSARFKVRQSGLSIFSTKYRELEPEKDELVARQAFYYVKYAFHTHIHHSQSSESLTTTHVIDSDPQVNASNLIDELKRGINVYRTNVQKSSFAVSGIALYGMSLVRSLSRECKLSDSSFLDTQLTYFQNIRNSIELCGGHQPDTFGGFFRQKLRSSLLLFFAIAAPILQYLNTRPSGDSARVTEMISTEREYVCGAFGGIGGVGGLCTEFYRFVELYIVGSFAPAFVVVLLLAWLLAVVNLIRSEFARHIDGTGRIKRLYSYITPGARSDKKGLGRLLYGLVLIRLVIRRLFIFLQQPKKLIGIIAVIALMFLALHLFWRFFVIAVNLLIP